MEKKSPENKLIWTNNLRVLATISVILLHVSGQILIQYGKVSDFVWWTGNLFDSFVRFCVPVFVMLTGALLLPKAYEIGEFLKKRFLRIILPFLFWSVVYIVFTYYVKLTPNHEMSRLEIITWSLDLLRSGTSPHLWYIYMIIGIYLITPIISKWAQNCKENEIIYFLIIWLAALILNQPILERYITDIDVSYFSDFIGYLVLGYYLSVKTFKYNKITINIIAILLILIGVIITIAGTYYLTNRDGKFNQYFYGYMTLNTLMVSAGIFVVFKNLNSNKSSKIIDFISKYSYGIYLVHVLVLFYLSKIGMDFSFMNPIFSIPLVTLLCLALSTLIIYAVNKLPYGKYISG
ncbi:acyltransferase [Flavobacterium sp.]|uniref:acyltransferase n=1 Tax=Flavobacterium sp. TaxID=239 RepID=UPI0037A04533